MVLPVSLGLAGALTEQALGLLLDLVVEQSGRKGSRAHPLRLGVDLNG
jgi:hypothetical protein